MKLIRQINQNSMVMLIIWHQRKKKIDGFYKQGNYNMKQTVYVRAAFFLLTSILRLDASLPYLTGRGELMGESDGELASKIWEMKSNSHAIPRHPWPWPWEWNAAFIYLSTTTGNVMKTSSLNMTGQWGDNEGVAWEGQCSKDASSMVKRATKPLIAPHNARPTPWLEKYLRRQKQCLKAEREPWEEWRL